MSLMTIAPATGNYGDDPDYYTGRADAYDDSATRTVDQMVVLASMAVDYASIPYALGYLDRVTELRRELDAVTAAETELAHTDLPKAATGPSQR
jgi:hypothetical protein